MERTNKMRTTTFTKRVIEAHMLRRSKVGVSCSRNTANTYKVATIRLLLNFQVAPPDQSRGITKSVADLVTRTGAPVPRPARRTVLLVKRENHVNGGVHFNRLAIEKSRLIAPLAHGIQRVLLQQRVARLDFELLNRAILGNDGVQAHRTGNAGLARERRIYRLNTIQNARGLDVAANLQRAGQLRLWRGWRSAHAANDAAEHAAHGATGDSAGDATGHADRAHVRLGLFLNNLDILGNDFRGHEFAGVHQVRRRLDADDLGGSRGRGWRRGWRRSREHRSHHGLGKGLGVDQRDENQDRKKRDLKQHRDDDRPRLVGLLRIRTRDHHFFKHGSTSYRREPDVRRRFRFHWFCCRLRVRCLLQDHGRANDSTQRRGAQRYQNWSTFLPQSPLPEQRRK